MNNKTITIFGNDNPDSIYKSFELKYLVLKKKPSDEQNSCFLLVDTRDADKKLPLCASSINLRDGETLT